jgi:hypothetical protein
MGRYSLFRPGRVDFLHHEDIEEAAVFSADFPHDADGFKAERFMESDAAVVSPGDAGEDSVESGGFSFPDYLLHQLPSDAFIAIRAADVDGDFGGIGVGGRSDHLLRDAQPRTVSFSRATITGLRSLCALNQAACCSRVRGTVSKVASV